MKSILLKRTFVLALLLWASWSSDAYAYVDPGIISSLFQLAYITIFGLMAFFIFRPIEFIKRLLKGKKTENEEQESDNLQE